MATEIHNPTDEDYEAAQRVIAQRQAAIAAERAQKFQPIRDLVTSDSFAQFNSNLANIPNDLAIAPEVAPFINAIRTGMNGIEQVLRTIIVPAPIAPPVITE